MYPYQQGRFGFPFVLVEDCAEKSFKSSPYTLHCVGSMSVALDNKRSMPGIQNTTEAMLLLIPILFPLSASLPRVVRHQHAACGAVFIYGHCCMATEMEEPEGRVEVEGQNFRL